ncbi:XRE family transcriptional regulator [Gallibacterium sp. AGMB14963]|uniref:XRE family transcriptional regulator n=1 Tax=Gallibacterium faecale TaxID=3019086 RepID=UPI0022F1AC66|nr:S24 family peptidase [Gallibacterium sp. AGMB14963]MDA3978526.1 helix-turn-helix domain-containing protein [Gallibacterium sp. AGMB14963]
MQSLAERLEKELNRQGISMYALAKMINVSQPAIAKIVKGETRDPKNIVEIANALNVNPHWLKTGEGSREITTAISPITSLVSNNEDEEHTYQIDRLDVQAAAAINGITNQDYPDIIQSIYFSKQGLIEIVGKKSTDNVYLITVPTDSMAPTINKGDLVFVDTKIDYYDTEGIYIFSLNGDLYIKRLMRLPTNVYKAISDNKLYPAFDISDDLFNTAKIVGKFIRVLPINAKEL